MRKYSHDTIIRVRLRHRPGQLARLAAAVAEQSALLGDISTVQIGENDTVRDITVETSDEAHTLRLLTFNTMFLCSVTTLLFNANPLLRYDGYYILSDLTGIANLSQRATDVLKFLTERGAFGIKAARVPPVRSRGIAAGVVSGHGRLSSVASEGPAVPEACRKLRTIRRIRRTRQGLPHLA